MEAGTPKQAAVRLAAAGSGVLLTLVLLIATACLLAGGSEPVAQSEQEASVDTWDAIETGESYKLPLADVTPVAVTPQPAAANYPVAAPTYLEPEPPGVGPEAPRPTETPPAPSGWDGPMTIHNPAAFGPPEDGSLPPIPTPSLRSTATPNPHAIAPEQLALAPAASPEACSVEGAGPEAPFEAGDELPVEPIEDKTAALAIDPAREVQPEPASQPEPQDLHDRQMAATDDVLSYTVSTNDLSKRLSSEVQAGFSLGRSGAVYAARSKFVSVLRRIALAKDAQEETTSHTEALAEGLRTLDDADDFVPRGDALEAELDVTAISRSHGLRLISHESAVAPHEAITRYSRHAASRLAEAAAGEPAGSMALYGLGKTYARLEAQSDDPTAGRKSLIMYRAAIDTHAENYLAANELGVQLARDGRYEQASRVLRQAAEQPTAIATVHANLAAIEGRLGRPQAAVLAMSQSERLAQRERAAGDVSRRHGVQWVDPEAFRRVGPTGAPMIAGQPSVQPATPPPGFVQQAPQQEEPAGGWTGFVRTAKRTIGWSSPAPTPQPGSVRPPLAAPQGRVLR